MIKRPLLWLLVASFAAWCALIEITARLTVGMLR